MVNNNSENGDGIRSERPLPPLPDDSLDRLDESPDDSDIEDIDDDSDVDISDEPDDDDDDEDVDDDQATTEQSTKLLNGTSSNGSNECEDSFNPDATLPPSPTKTSNTSFAEFNNSNSSLETPSSPENDRFYIQIKIFSYFIRSNIVSRLNDLFVFCLQWIGVEC